MSMELGGSATSPDCIWCNLGNPVQAGMRWPFHYVDKERDRYVRCRLKRLTNEQLAQLERDCKVALRKKRR